jgi:AcrR family transcriptional regulator
MSTPLSGRKAQAARNDEVILEAARAVFLDDPGAPIAAVAERAHVGISALYRRYPSKEELLRKLCSDGLAAYTAAAQAAVDELDAGGEAWQVFASFMRRVIDAGSTSLTIRLAGTFRPDEQLYRAAAHANDLNHKMIQRVREAGAIRDDIEVADIGLILEQIASIRLGDEARTAELRHRYLALVLQGLSRPDPATLPGTPPSPEELAARWTA